MSARPVKIPGPDHPIAVTKNPKRITVSVNGKMIASTTNALSLKEASYPAVQYIPRGDANMAMLERSSHATYCPYKGDASYYSIPSAGERGENAVWSYEHPHDAMRAIRDYLAFYPDRVTIEER
ncbi:MAG: DUF427 domain-containing protein [Proteobacteria bacterium]|nr:DUF427 domain-containing protein [Pseudomonadota bacterium]